MGLLISTRGDGGWRGRSTAAVGDRGDKRLLRLVNGYVSADGHEIRQRPGWHTILDLTADNNESTGFERRVVDSRRPVYDWSRSNSLYQYLSFGSNQTVVSWAEVKHLHCIEQVRGRTLLIGESGFRRNPIYGSPRTEITITGLHITSSWNLQVSSTPAVHSIADSGNAGGNGLNPGDVVYVEIVSTSAVLSPFVQSELTNFFGVVKQVVADSVNPGKAYITLLTQSAGSITTSPHPTTGYVHRVRCNRSDVYPVSPLEPDPYKAIDDPDALTLWTVEQELDLDNPCTTKSHVAWVANRQRDHGDDETANSNYEGVRTSTAAVSPEGNRSVSKRRQKSLPYRVNPEVAGNRLVLAAPGYGCLFQCPLVIPNTTEGWPTLTDWSPAGGAGYPWYANDLHDKPRALGVPKAILVDSTISPVPTGTPVTWTAPYNFLVYGITGTGAGWPAGTYRFAISYVDDMTGEEGLASEEVRLTLASATPAQGYSYGIQLTYLHPGYYFPECLAMSVNVYLATSDSEALALYKKIPLQNGFTTPTLSSKFGQVIAGTPNADGQSQLLTVQLPAPLNSSPISNARDTTRLAPQNLQMPRGGECFRYIRGIGLSCGSLGTHGKSYELWHSRASAQYIWTTPTLRRDDDVLQIKTAATPIFDATTPAQTRDGPFGIASNYFPPAYTGVGLFSSVLYPAPRRLAFTDTVLNSLTSNTTSGGFDKNQAHEQRIRMDESIWDIDKGAAGSPYPQEKIGEFAYMVMPRGQVQVSEPGRPEVMIGTAIQLIDPARDDDAIAIGHYNGGAIICTTKETFNLNWYRAPQGQIPVLVTNEHGCIATNSMVEFDGGLAWIGERGPVAMTGQGFEWVGMDLEKDFHGSTRRYALDSRGRMRHCWSAHDRQRGLVYWGLVTTDATHQISYGATTGAFSAHNDQGKSRFPCNEVLVWSYRTNSFSTWVQPSGLEILWMRPLKDKNGETRMCFLAADQRVYAMDEEWHDTNREVFSSTTTAAGTGTTITLVDSFGIDGNGGTTARGTGDNLLRIGMPVVVFDADGNITERSTVTALTVASNQVTVADTITWGHGVTVHVGYRPDMTVETTYTGQTSDNLDVESLQVRYALQNTLPVKAFAKVTSKMSDLLSSPTTVGYTEQNEWVDLGTAQAEIAAMRRSFEEGRSTAPEVNFKLVFTGAAHVRVTDIMLEVASAG